jgi:hypothetical protein
MSSMLQMETSGFQNILISLVVICIVIYCYIEFRKINYRLTELEAKVYKLDSPLSGDIPMDTINIPSQSQRDEDSIKTSISETDNSQPGMSQQGMSQPGMSQQGISQPGMSQPGMSQQGTSNKIKKSNKVVPEMNGLFIAVGETNIIEKPVVDERIVEITDNEEDHDIVENIIEDTSIVVEKNDVEANINSENIVEKNSYSPSDNVSSANVSSANVSSANVSSDNVQENSISLDISESNINDADIGDPILENLPINYEEYSIKELKNILEEMELSTSGNKNKLIERIVSHKK